MKKIILIIFLVISSTTFSQTKDSFYQSGLNKTKLEDYNGAIEDYSKAIELNPKYSDAFYNRGITKLKINEKNSACLDFSSAGELGDSDAYKAIKKYCN